MREKICSRPLAFRSLCYPEEKWRLLVVYISNSNLSLKYQGLCVTVNIVNIAIMLPCVLWDFRLAVKLLVIDDKITASCPTNIPSKHYIKRYEKEKLKNCQAI